MSLVLLITDSVGCLIYNNIHRWLRGQLHTSHSDCICLEIIFVLPNGDMPKKMIIVHV